MTNEEVLDLVFRIREDVEYKKDEQGIVTVFEKQDHRIQRFFRKLNCYIPLYKAIELDEYCSAVFTHIDGKCSVREIGEILDDRYGEDVYPLYERLLLFLNSLEVNCKYIERIEKGAAS